MTKKTDLWRTPPQIIEYVKNRFGEIQRDLCASSDDAVCSFYYDVEDDFLKQRVKSFEMGSTGFLNPPYSNPLPFVKKAIEFGRGGMRVIMLLNMDTSTKWFELIASNASLIMPIIGGRLAFLSANGEAMKGNNKAQVLIEFSPYFLGAAKWEPIHISEIYKSRPK